MLLHNKHTLVQEGFRYLRNGTMMGMCISVLTHLTMKYILQVTAIPSHSGILSIGG